MSGSQQFQSSLSLRQLDRHAQVERQGLALGAARERSRYAASLARDREQRMDAAIDGWENEGGTAVGVATPSSPERQKLSPLQILADLFRDDNILRAVIVNGLLLLFAGVGFFLLLNN